MSTTQVQDTLWTIPFQRNPFFTGRVQILTSLHTIVVHRLVQTVLRNEMDDDAQQQWAKRAILAVNWSFPDVQDVEERSKCQQWLPHALVCADFIEKWKLSFNEAACLMNQAGYYLEDRAQYAQAEPLYKRALEIREEVQGERHPDTALSLNNWGCSTVRKASMHKRTI